MIYDFQVLTETIKGPDIYQIFSSLLSDVLFNILQKLPFRVFVCR